MKQETTDFVQGDVSVPIRVSGLSYRVDGISILSELDFHSTRTRIGIIGRNGSGKTTLARLLAGLIRPTEGHIDIAGVDVATDRRAALRLVGVLFQNPDHQIIFPTVIEELAFGLRQLGQSREAAEQAAGQTLRRFGKQRWADASTHALSQGQKQLLCLMSVLAMRPRVLILDEPLSGLDLPTRMQLSRYLDQSDAVLIHITHDPSDLRGYDEVLWLDRGKLREQGDAPAVLERFVAEMRRIGMDDDISDIPG